MKQELNVNQSDEQALKTADRTELMYELQNTNIRFDLDEKGPDAFKKEDRILDMDRLSARVAQMQTINEAQDSRVELDQEDDKVLIAGQQTLVQLRLTNHVTGSAIRSQSGQHMRSVYNSF